MRQLARILAKTRDGIPVARLEGEVDMTNAQSLGERLRGLLTNRSVALVVDLGPTTYLDSSRITLLFGLAQGAPPPAAAPPRPGRFADRPRDHDHGPRSDRPTHPLERSARARALIS